MSLMALNRAFKKHGTVVVSILAVLMLGGIVFSGFGMNVNRGGGPVAPQPAVASETPVATVGTAQVTKADLENRLKRLLQQQAMFGGPSQVPPVEREKARYSLLDGIKREQAMVMAAEKKGVKVSDADIAAEREKVWEQQRPQFAKQLDLKDPEKATDNDIDRALAEQAPGRGITAARLKADVAEDQLKLQLYQQGLVDAVKKEVAVTEDEVKKSYDDIQVRHILIQSGDHGLPDAQAKTKAEKILAEVKANPAKMPDLAKQFSDDPGSKNKGGLYEWAPAGQYVPEFTKAALDAGVGKVYPEPVKTQFGYHIIKNEGVKSPGKTLPKDWDKEKQKYIDQYREQHASGKVQEAVTAELPNVKVEVTDPSLKASEYEETADKAGTDEKIRNTAYEQALAELAKVKKEDDPYGIVPLRKAQIYQRMKKSKEAIAAYQEALDASNTVETRIALAELYLKEKDKDNAAKQLEEADKLAVPDLTMQFHMADLWDKVGNKEKAKAAHAKMEAMLKRQMEMQAAQQPPVTVPPTAPAPKTAASPKAGASPEPKASPASTAASPSPAPPASPKPSPAAH